MIPANQIKNGMTIILNGEIFSIVSFEHYKPGKGGAIVRTKLRNIKSGNILERNFRAEEKLEQAFVEERKVQFLYRQADIYHFMDQTTFEEIELGKERLGENTKFLKENMLLSISVCEGAIIEINLPNFVEMKIVQTEPGVRADTVKTATKEAILETGAKIDVPLFVNNGDTIKIDTRTQKYIGRA